MANVKVAPRAKWREPTSSQAARAARDGFIVADGEFYIVSTSGPADAFAVEDGDFLIVDDGASEGRALRVVGKHVRIEDG